MKAETFIELIKSDIMARVNALDDLINAGYNSERVEERRDAYLTILGDVGDFEAAI